MTLGWGSTCEQVAAALPEGAREIAGTTVIVTGSNTGIGLEAARQFARLGAHVVMACRNAAKAEKARDEICAKNKDTVPQSRVSIITVDLGDLASVESFVKEFSQRSEDENWPPLRTLVLNAGLILSKAERSAQGYEKTFATNHLGHMALTLGLLPVLRENAPGRVVVLSSDSHYGPLAEKNVESVEALRNVFVQPSGDPGASISLKKGMELYGSSKLCNLLFAKELHARESDNGIVACSLHPGTLIATDIVRNQNGLVQFLTRYVISFFTKSVNQGTSTTMYCSLAPHDSLQGQYYDNCAPKRESKRATSTAAKVLWDLSEELLGQQSRL
ncbi:WW domain-containing oxidoreductase [Hondaea fermentalgiana]|uniref:WW domain-containing oxidoreductase n=1 Tax=Hondaea fermentalgiana TaxID=2315210 RepID=A0A2R5GQQ1_9STRA|nr:WW domain-containing oxidoreductase [Hondaea fermentalgiana]|eukprot:GBG32639.1 WW domain-containing oxidoreductase [Hondaea fermentalgiana]